MDDAALVALIGRGDERAFAQLVDRYLPMLLGRARRIVRDPQLAEDVPQVVFAKVWTSSASFDPTRGSVGAWLNMLTRSASVDVVRNEERHRRRTERAAMVEAPKIEQPDEAAGRTLEAARVRAALERLNPEQKAAIELAYFNGMTYIEVAEALNEPEGTIKSRIRRGLIQLAKEIGNAHER